MAQSTESQTYTAFPNQLFDDLVQGKIDNMMFNILIWLYRRANWKSGIAVRASSQQIRAELWGGWTYEKNPPSERTIQEKLRRLVQMGYIVSHHTAGRRGTYSISINNYPALTPAGEEITLRPTETKSLDEVLAAFCGDDSGESSAESSSDPAVSLPRTHSTTLDSPASDPTNHSTEDQPRVSEKVRSAAVAASMSNVAAAGSGEAEAALTDRERDFLCALIPETRDETRLLSEVKALRAILKLHSELEFWNYWNWNQTHKTGKLKHFALADALNALNSDSARSAWNQFQKCWRNPCPKDRPNNEYPMPVLAGDPCFRLGKHPEKIVRDLFEAGYIKPLGDKWYIGWDEHTCFAGYRNFDALMEDLDGRGGNEPLFQQMEIFLTSVNENKQAFEIEEDFG